MAGLSTTAVGVERRTAFVTRLAELGMRLTGTVSYGAYSYQAGWRGALHLLAGKPDAIFFASDILALGGIDALREEANLEIPEEIAVAGFDDIAMAAWPRYSLTTYRQPINDLIETILELLSADDRQIVHKSIPGELVVRGSTIPVASRSPS